MWFKYLIIFVFTVEAVTNIMGYFGKRFNQPTLTATMITGVFFVVMAIMAFILIK
jgi:hypothetical protein